MSDEHRADLLARGETDEEEIRAVVVEPSQALAVVPPTTPVKASDLVERLATIREAMDQAMERDVDYGVIPGTGSKPTLLKPGAEKLAVLFQLDVQITHDEKWGPGDHLTVPAYATVYHALSGARLGRGEGMCSTRERKYAYRQEQRTCPECGVQAIIKGKEEYGGGWLCFKKKGGCGAKWPDGAAEIESQTQGEVENPDLPDLWNTVIKMARKRALVDAVLLVTGASALFTQDMEDAAVPAKEPTGRPKPSGELISDEQRTTMVNAIKDAGLDLADTLEAAKIYSLLSPITVSQARRVRKMVDAAKANVDEMATEINDARSEADEGAEAVAAATEAGHPEESV